MHQAENGAKQALRDLKELFLNFNILEKYSLPLCEKVELESTNSRAKQYFLLTELMWLYNSFKKLFRLYTINKARKHAFSSYSKCVSFCKAFQFVEYDELHSEKVETLSISWKELLKNFEGDIKTLKIYTSNPFISQVHADDYCLISKLLEWLTYMEMDSFALFEQLLGQPCNL